MNRKMRYHVLDEIRGWTLLNMIAFHAIWDIVYIYGADWEWYRSVISYIWQQSICWTFILLSGFCWSLGRNKLKRGTIVFLSGILVTSVTYIFMPDQRVIFGVLTFLGTASIMMLLFDKVLKNIPAIPGAVFSFLLFLLFRNINSGYLGFEGWNIRSLPKWLYQNYFTAYIGFPMPEFTSTDYFSVLPWFFLFVTGYFIYRILEQKELLEKLSKSYGYPLGIIGKNSLIIYLIHQPVIYVLLMIFMK